ncbi:hypothetical protein B0T25DRAFT_620386 [Lasiosphaeria hispida]|uniref:NACHT domain-containing protein n=1 Tax=Lasiosphaeria hispida TaxID=260671 RepID=A0AAJ0HWI4_9PEZI|nr:hypothetical protein B0T25DRAFT_620386 [Lasiosphaeria hispida]
MAGSCKKRWANWRERREKSKARDRPKTHGSGTAAATPPPPSTASPTPPSGVTSPTLSAEQSLGMVRPSAGLEAFSRLTFPTEAQPTEQGISEHGLIAPSGTTTERRTPPSPSQRLWDAAYNSLAEDENTAKLIRSYVETLEEVLGDKDSKPSAADVSARLKDPNKRQTYMRKLVEDGQAKISTSSKITQGVGDVVQFVLSAKAMIDLAIQNIPQAALPWAGVCIALQILLNPVQAIESNLAGITHVISRMDWYCALTEHILSQNNIVVGKDSFKSVQLRLENRVIELYKALLLYQIKSVCSFYRHQGWVFLRGLANIDDWDADLKIVTYVEATLQNDLSQFNSQHTKSLLGQLAEEAKKRKALLGDIHQALQSSIAVQKEINQALQDGIVAQKVIHRDEKDTQCLQDLRLTDPRHDRTRIIETKGGLLADAYHWILDNAEFRQWCDDEQSRLLWIKGDPGKGKTMLLCGIIDKLQSSTLGRGLLSFFFCQATDARINNATAVLRGLIYLLLDQQPSLIPHARNKYDHAGRALFEDANGWVALSEIFTNILQDPSLEGAYLIIDALDECINDLPKLLKFIVEMSSTFPHVKWIVSSRNWPEIEKDLNAATRKVRLCLELNEASVSEAVTAYVKFKVHRLAERNKYKPDTRDAVQSYLSENAHGTFLWVALVCQNLDNIPERKAQKKLTAFPPGLDALYQRMMDHISDSNDSEDADLCKSILAIMSAVRRPIMLDELAAFVAMPGEASADYEVLAEIIGLCGSFLTLRERTISFIHQSAKDFLLGPAAHELFPSGIKDIHHTVFSQSLRVMNSTLCRDIYSLGAPGSSIDDAKLPDPDPLAAARYTCVYWVDHLHDWQSSDNTKHLDVFQDGGIIDNFLRTHYLHWLEALSLCRSMSQGILSMAKLESILQLPSLVYDMRRFVLYCGWVVENHPLQVYASALVFSPTRSMTRNLFKQEHTQVVESVTFSPDLKLVASGSYDQTVKIWDAATGACMQTLAGHSDYVNSVTFSPDSKLVASGSADNTVKIWDVATGACMQTLAGHSKYVSSVTFSPDSKLVASGSADKTVNIWDAVTGACMRMLVGHSDYVKSVVFSPDSKLMASGSSDNTVKIWDVVMGVCTQMLAGHSDYVSSITFSPDLKLMASESADKTVKIWDVATGIYTQILVGHSDYIKSIVFSPDLKLVASGSYDKTVKIWDVATGACMQTLAGHSHHLSSVAFSPDSKLVASGSADKTVKIWDVVMGAYTQMLAGHSHYVNSIAFSPDLKLVASGSSDKTMKIWDAVTGACMQTLVGHSDYGNSVTFSPDSKLVASRSYKTMKIWDVATGTCMQTLVGHSDYVQSIVFSPNLKLVASGSYDKTMKIWDVATGACMQTLAEHSDYVNSVAFSPDAKLVGSGSYKTVKIWDVATGACMQTLAGHSDFVRSIVFSPDSKLVASGSSDNTMKIWDVATGACTQTLAGHCDGSDVMSSWSRNQKTPYHQDYKVDRDGRWIMRGLENWLWLPPDYQARCSTLAASTIAIGCLSGRVLVMTFPTDN